MHSLEQLCPTFPVVSIHVQCGSFYKVNIAGAQALIRWVNSESHQKIYKYASNSKSNLVGSNFSYDLPQEKDPNNLNQGQLFPNKSIDTLIDQNNKEESEDSRNNGKSRNVVSTRKISFFKERAAKIPASPQSLNGISRSTDQRGGFALLEQEKSRNGIAKSSSTNRSNSKYQEGLGQQLGKRELPSEAKFSFKRSRTQFFEPDNESEDESTMYSMSLCPECKESVPHCGLQEHMDWHLAKSLSET
jgi:hypothetical protein